MSTLRVPDGEQIELRGDWSVEELLAACRILDEGLFGELAVCLKDMEEDLRLLLDVTDADRERWPEDRNELAIGRAEVDAMPPAEKLSYVARMIYWLAIDYGVGAGEGSEPRMTASQGDTPAGFLRRLTGVLGVSLPTTRPSDMSNSRRPSPRPLSDLEQPRKE